mmetsp:Transcript_98680/g.159058  ORF Transcript_98680/g.159058 Transcript_98680/m.159058 type:complete len:82 (+) Transcript_98680:52-297(+)
MVWADFEGGRPRQRKERPAAAAFDLQPRTKSLDVVATRVITEAMASKEAALVLDCGDEAQQVQERKNEGAKNLPAGTALLH